MPLGHRRPGGSWKHISFALSPDLNVPAASTSRLLTKILIPVLLVKMARVRAVHDRKCLPALYDLPWSRALHSKLIDCRVKDLLHLKIAQCTFCSGLQASEISKPQCSSTTSSNVQ
eukprot:scpid39434/ scgid25001/ 